jgi:hypothetical protein
VPFTPAHVAAVLPFHRLRRSTFTALVIGSMVPDTPIYLGIGPTYETTHSLYTGASSGVIIGMFWFLLYEWAKGPALQLLPDRLRARLVSRAAQPPLDSTAWAFVFLGLACGALTHIGWDAFTHERGWGVRLVPALNEVWLDTRFAALPGYRVLQYASSVLGLVAVGLATWRAVRARPPVPLDSSRAVPSWLRTAFLVLFGVGVPSLCLVSALQELVSAGGNYSRRVVIHDFLARTCALQLALLLGMAAVLRLCSLAAPPPSR